MMSIISLERSYARQQFLTHVRGNGASKYAYDFHRISMYWLAYLGRAWARAPWASPGEHIRMANRQGAPVNKDACITMSLCVALSPGSSLVRALSLHYAIRVMYTELRYSTDSVKIMPYLDVISECACNVYPGSLWEPGYEATHKCSSWCCTQCVRGSLWEPGYEATCACRMSLVIVGNAINC